MNLVNLKVNLIVPKCLKNMNLKLELMIEDATAYRLRLIICVRRMTLSGVCY